MAFSTLIEELDQCGGGNACLRKKIGKKIKMIRKKMKTKNGETILHYYHVFKVLLFINT